MPKCIDCKSKEASFNVIGETKRLYCSLCKTSEMINVKHKMCIVCKKTIANYNYENEDLALYCVGCKTDDMINVNSKKCIVCKKKRAYYNYEGQDEEKYCRECRLDDMIILKPRNCIKCGKLTATFNISGESKRLYCSKCKTDDMEDVRHQKCKNTFCNIILSYKNKYEGYCVQCYTRQYPDRPILKNYKPKEISVSSFLKNVFTDHVIKFDKRISDNSKKRPDVLFDLQTHVIVVEIDEHQHKHYINEEENKRVENLSSESNKPIVFIRFNPDGYTDSKGTRVKSCWSYDDDTKLSVVKDVDSWNGRLLFLKSRVRHWCDNLPENKVLIEYLFFDGCSYMP